MLIRVVINVVIELIIVKVLNYRGITYYRVLLMLIGYHGPGLYTKKTSGIDTRRNN
jgi:hypothetical protein